MQIILRRRIFALSLEVRGVIWLLQLGHMFWVAVMGPYGGLLFGTANWLRGESPGRTVPSMNWAGKLTANRNYRYV